MYWILSWIFRSDAWFGCWDHLNLKYQKTMSVVPYEAAKLLICQISILAVIGFTVLGASQIVYNNTHC